MVPTCCKSLGIFPTLNFLLFNSEIPTTHGLYRAPYCLYSERKTCFVASCSYTTILPGDNIIAAVPATAERSYYTRASHDKHADNHIHHPDHN